MSGTGGSNEWEGAEILDNPLTAGQTRCLFEDAEKGALATGMKCKGTKNPPIRPVLKQRLNGATLKIPSGLLMEELKGEAKLWMVTLIYHINSGKTKVGTRHTIQDKIRSRIIEMGNFFHNIIEGKEIKMPRKRYSWYVPYITLTGECEWTPDTEAPIPEVTTTTSTRPKHWTITEDEEVMLKEVVSYAEECLEDHTVKKLKEMFNENFVPVPSGNASGSASGSGSGATVHDMTRDEEVITEIDEAEST